MQLTENKKRLIEALRKNSCTWKITEDVIKKYIQEQEDNSKKSN